DGGCVWDCIPDARRVGACLGVALRGLAQRLSRPVAPGPARLLAVAARPRRDAGQRGRCRDRHGRLAGHAAVREHAAPPEPARPDGARAAGSGRIDHIPTPRRCPMTVYADTPRWPRHGTLWGHLISDTPLDELHEAAARAGLPPRAFDLDHYDWPVSARDAVHAAEAVFVGDRELTRILRGSGLRVKLVDRPAARARRSAEHAAALGLHPVPRDFIHGPLGHVDPLPNV